MSEMTCDCPRSGDHGSAGVAEEDALTCHGSQVKKLKNKLESKLGQEATRVLNQQRGAGELNLDNSAHVE